MVNPLVVIFRTRQHKIRLVKLHYVLVRVLTIWPNPEGDKNVIVVESQLTNNLGLTQ